MKQLRDILPSKDIGVVYLTVFEFSTIYGIIVWG